MKTKKRIEVTAYRRQLSVQYAEPIAHGDMSGPALEGGTGPPQLCAGPRASDHFPPAHIARVNEVTMLVKTLIETEGKSRSLSCSRMTKLKLLLRQVRSRINSFGNRQGMIGWGSGPGVRWRREPGKRIP